MRKRKTCAVSTQTQLQKSKARTKSAPKYKSKDKSEIESRPLYQQPPLPASLMSRIKPLTSYFPPVGKQIPSPHAESLVAWLQGKPIMRSMDKGHEKTLQVKAQHSSFWILGWKLTSKDSLGAS
jgi:hypothetical protein